MESRSVLKIFMLLLIQAILLTACGPGAAEPADPVIKEGQEATSADIRVFKSPT